FFFLQAEDGIRDFHVTGVQTCALPISNEAGGYTFATIPSGTYILKVSKEGFSPFTENQVPVTINSVTRVDVTLKVGGVSQAVEVDRKSVVLQTDRSEVRAELTGMELRELPVPVRN